MKFRHGGYDDVFRDSVKAAIRGRFVFDKCDPFPITVFDSSFARIQVDFILGHPVPPQDHLVDKSLCDLAIDGHGGGANGELESDFAH